MKKIVIGILLALLFQITTAAAAGNVTSTKDIIGDPIQTFNGLPDSTKNGILLVTGLVFLGALICVVYAILISIGKTTLGSTSSDAKMRSEGVGALLTIAGIVLLAVIVLGFVFYYFTPGHI